MTAIAEATIHRQEGVPVPEQEKILQISRPELAFLAAGVEHKADELSSRGYDLPDPGFIEPMSDSLTREEVKAFTNKGKKDIFTARLEIIDKVQQLLKHPHADEMIQKLANEHPDQAELLLFFKSPANRKDHETGKISDRLAIETFREQILADHAASKNRRRL